MKTFGQESETLEFKKTTGEMHDAMIAITAILNKHGSGTLYFGILPNGIVKGQQVTESTLRDVSRTIYEAIKPQIYPIVKRKIIDEKEIVEVEFNGENKPYSAYGKYYIRVADENKEMSPIELKKIMIAQEYESNWERKLTEYNIDEIDDATLEKFFNRAIACGRLPQMDYNKESLLTKLDLYKNGKLNNAGYMLFSKNASIVLKMAVFATEEKLTFLDINRYEDNIFNLIDIALDYVKKNIRWKAEIVGIKREETPEVPISALREIIVNSFSHAQYSSSTQHEIDIHPNKIVVYNPGEFPFEYTPEDFANSDLQSIIRNELILKTLYRCNDVESFGGGFKKVYKLCKENNVLCNYKKTSYGFAFIFHRQNVTVNVTQNVTVKLNTTEEKIIDLLTLNPNYSREDIAKEISKTVRTVQRSLDRLKEKGIISRIGSDKTGYWKVN